MIKADALKKRMSTNSINDSTDEQVLLNKWVSLAKEDERIAVLWLYGSRAKGTAKTDSDFDLAVAFSTWPEDRWQRRLQSEMLALEWADATGLSEGQLSILDINLAPLPLAFNVVTTGRVLWARDHLRLAREENRITSMWEVDYLYHREQYG